MKTLYVLAGNGGHAGLWHELQPLVHGWQLEPVELPGFGSNPEPPCDGLDAWVDALLAHTRPGAVLLACGVSGLIALQAARRAPHHFSRLLLLGPVGAYLGERRLPGLLRLPGVGLAARLVLGWAPWLLSRHFQGLSAAARATLAKGYRQCRAFVPWFRAIRADNALDQLEWHTGPVDIVWGGRDVVQPARWAAAWTAILARAQLRVFVRDDWGHYPWLEQPAAFAAFLDDLPDAGLQLPGSERGLLLDGHTKAGRLQLASLAGLRVPHPLVLRAGEPVPPVTDGLYAVRSSTAAEDRADCANAGRSVSHVRVPAAAVAATVQQLRATGVAEVLVQPFIEPRVSGVAFVRHLSAEIDWVNGHLHGLVDGSVTPGRCVLSRLGAPWGECPATAPALGGLSAHTLWQFLQDAIRVFHWQHADIEWAWDGQQVWLLQLRPVTRYGWRRYLSSANVDEILPPAPSRLLEHAQRRAASAIPAVLARWDSEVLRDNEPFTAQWQEASFLNLDWLLARLHRWGLPARRLTDEIGGAAPSLRGQVWRLLRASPRLLRLVWGSRAALAELEPNLRRWQAELRAVPPAVDALVHWWSCRYVDMVRGNLLLAIAIDGAGGSLPLQVPPLYRALGADAVHRLPWETDPATPRVRHRPAPALRPRPTWPWWLRVWHRLGLPGMESHYRVMREWYRDNLMCLFFELHQRLHTCPDSVQQLAPWLQPVCARTRRGGFWQSGADDAVQTRTLLLVPGLVDGTLGDDILLEDALDPGSWQRYAAARAVIARCGGRLSHGATLLRELGVPSAILPHVDASLRGRRVRFADGVVTVLDA